MLSIQTLKPLLGAIFLSVMLFLQGCYADDNKIAKAYEGVKGEGYMYYCSKSCSATLCD